jgi:SAM-dependent methyltransferase
MAGAVRSLWDRVFASLYDRVMAASEREGLSAKRHELLADARGVTLELGAGTGLNLDHYPANVDRLVLLEPSPHMAAKLRARLAAQPGGPDRPAVEVVEAGGETLPFADDEFDTVVATLVLCTIPDPAAALREVARVLKPGGELLFLEHVRSGEPRVARWQDRLETPWKWVADGCHCNRDTLAALNASPLAVERVRDDQLPKAMPLVEPLIVGAARAT